MKHILIIILIFISAGADAQHAITWQKNIGGTNTEYANAVDTTIGGDMYAAGVIRSTIGEYTMQYFNPVDNLAYDAWIVKYNKYGNMLWQKVFGGNNTDEFFDVKATADGGAIAVGRSNSTNGNITANKGGEDIIVVKYDANGNIEWNKNYGSTLLDGARTVLPMPDGSYVLNCYSNGNNLDFTGGKGLKDVWMMQISATGNIIRKKNFGGSGNDDAADLIRANNNNWVFVATTGSLNGDVTGSHGGDDVWVVKVDSSWNIVQKKCFGGSNKEGANSITLLPDGFLIAANVIFNSGDVTGIKGAMDAWIIKTDTSLNSIWMKTYGGTQADVINKIILLPNNNVLLGGETKSTDGDITTLNAGLSDAWLFELNTDQNAIVWSKTYGDLKADYCKDLLIWGNNDFLFGGMISTTSLIAPHPQLWLATSKTLPTAGPLPVLGLDFYVKRLSSTTVQLDWKTTQEINNKGFHIERKKEGETSFSDIGFRLSATPGGNSSSALNYTTTDENNFVGKTYYRLKQEDIDGRFVYSNVRVAVSNSDKQTVMQVWPIPTTGPLHVLVNGLEKLDVLLIYDIAGKVVKQHSLQNNVQVEINNLAPGSYFLHAGKNNDLTRKVVVL